MDCRVAGRERTKLINWIHRCFGVPPVHTAGVPTHMRIFTRAFTFFSAMKFEYRNSVEHRLHNEFETLLQLTLPCIKIDFSDFEVSRKVKAQINIPKLRQFALGVEQIWAEVFSYVSVRMSFMCAPSIPHNRLNRPRRMLIAFHRLWNIPAIICSHLRATNYYLCICVTMRVNFVATRISSEL